MHLREVQSQLAIAGLYGGAIDGIHGPRTAVAIEALFLARPVLTGNWRGWSPARRAIAAAQIFCLLDGIEVGAIDGLKGPQTRHAFEVYAARKRGIEGVENWRDHEPEHVSPELNQYSAHSRASGNLVQPAHATVALGPRLPRRRSRGAERPASIRRGDSLIAALAARASRSPARLGDERNVASAWPRQSQREMEKFFGPVGANQATLDLPEGYSMRIAWEPSKKISRFSCHEKICASARRVLVRVLDHYGPARIGELGLDRFGGCLNVRRMRGGSAWSTHAWGAAFDFDPARNQLKWTRARAQFARPEYEKWWSLWEAEGFVSLGRARDFDWMHIQAARL
jgi:hypothetical protein